MKLLNNFATSYFKDDKNGTKSQKCLDFAPLLNFVIHKN